MALKEDIKARIHSWERVAAAQERELARSLPEVNTPDAVRLFDSLCKDALKNLPNRKTSGLVEQQRWFQRLRS